MARAAAMTSPSQNCFKRVFLKNIMTGMLDSNRKVAVFVKSVKGVTSEKVGYYTARVRVQDRGVGTVGVFRPYTEETVTKDEFILPEDQKEIVEMVWEIASNRGFEVEVVDVTKENILRREIQEHAKHITTLPTVITDDGRRIEGNITKQQIETLLTKPSAR